MYFGSLFWSLHIQMNEIQIIFIKTAQRPFTCSQLTIETLEHGVKYVQS